VVIGGSWNSNEEEIVTIHGFNPESTPVQIAIKSIQEVKAKSSISLKKILAACNDHESLASIKSPKVEFTYCNIVPLPHLLTKVFIDLANMDPLSVALAFFHATHAFDESLDMVKDTTDFNPLL
jgi:hypothetical protein